MGDSGNNSEEQEGGKDDEVHDTLQQGGTARAQGNDADQQGQHQKHFFLAIQAERERFSQQNGNARDGGDCQPNACEAEPRARFMLVCRRFTRAARKAAIPSGSSTNAAMTMPTKLLGAPRIPMAYSRVGVSALARTTIATRATISRPKLIKEVT